jgi:PAS domain S-box-containing protein
MVFNRLFRQSLITRTAVITLTIFLLSIWSLTLFASRMLRADMEDVLGAQQLSAATFGAATINGELLARIKALEIVAKTISPTLLATPADVQTVLEQRPLLLELFNGGAFVTRFDGTAIASVPTALNRVGFNYMAIERDFIIAALKEGKNLVGKPVFGQKLKSPLFSMAVPLRDGEGKVIGALVGTTDLSQPNFLDKVAQNQYGKTGGYVLLIPKHRLIVTATDKSRIMQPLPALGVNPPLDRFLQGYEGSAVYTNPLGVEVVGSARQIPAAGWLLGVTLPTREAFAPVRAMQERMLIAATTLTLLATILTCWMLRRQLSPLRDAATAMVSLSNTQQIPHPLPIANEDEVGQLVGGFNRLLATWTQREEALKASEFRWKFAIEGSGDGVWDWDIASDSADYSRRWKEMLGYGDADILPTNQEWVTRIHPDDQLRVADTMQAYLEGRTEIYVVEYRLRCKDESYKWILGRGMVVSRSPEGKPTRMIGTHTDITAQKKSEDALQSSLREKVALLNEVHHRVKNNLQVITSLLRLEARRSAQADTKVVLGEMQGRIRSMAVLHESLYRSGIFASVDLGAYLKNLATQAFRAQMSPRSGVRLQLELTPIQVSMDQATPCGLLVNELISNALKHGFPDDHSGEVRIELQALAAGQGGPTSVRLCVSDTGVGLSADFESRRDNSLGLQLVSDLTRQLDGVLEIGPRPRAIFTVTFLAEGSVGRLV